MEIKRTTLAGYLVTFFLVRTYSC
uniref:Uncharacterized protein n=1 Tax=Anguilla anguilla TaxID=7936 RepID=A0A0E9Q3Z7_ANGAN